MIGDERQTLCLGQPIHRLDVADAARRIALPQRSVKGRVAVAREPARVAKRPVDDQHAAGGQHLPDA